MNGLNRIKEDRRIESDAAFARLLGESQQTFTGYLKKGRIPGADQLLEWSQKLGLTIEQLLLIETTNAVQVDTTLKDDPKFPDLSWMLAEYAEQTVIEKMSKALLDVSVPLDERLRRARIFWLELERRANSETQKSASGKMGEVVKELDPVIEQMKNRQTTAE